MRSDRFVAVTAGLLWGALGAVFAQPWFSVQTWQGVVAGLLIGVGVARFHDWVAPRSVWGLLWLSALTFTLAAGAFGAAAQLMFEMGWLSRALNESPGFTSGVAQAFGRLFIAAGVSVLGVWAWGMFIVFWPLAFVTHFVYWVASDPDTAAEAS